MKNNDQPKKSFFDIVLQNSNQVDKQQPPKTEKPEAPKSNPFFLLGLIIGFFFYSWLLNMGLGVLSSKIAGFPTFSYFETLKLYMGFWIILHVIKKR